jgi:hypothetical protein
MVKRIVLAVSILLFAAPVWASADTGAADAQLIALYTELIALLQKELTILQNPSEPSLVVAPTSGMVPLQVSYTITNTSGTEAIDFGDGHSSGSNGCAKNAQGYCDLSQPIAHLYQFPGTYTVTLYNHQNNKTKIVSTAKVIVGALTSEH